MILDLKGFQSSGCQYSSNEYQKARSERLRLDENTCQICGSKRYLQVHHINRTRNDNPNPYTDLVTLCDCCHKRVEDTIKEQTFRDGEFDFTVVSAQKDFYDGSEKMEPCERIKVTLLVYDVRTKYARYVKDTLPILNQFSWKWKEFLLSIGLEQVDRVNSETIDNLIIDKTGTAIFKTSEGSAGGSYSKVDHYKIKGEYNEKI